MSFLFGTQTELIYALGTPVTANTYTTQRVISAPNTAPRAILPAQFFSYLSGGNKGVLVKGAGTIGATTGTNNFTAVLGWDPSPGTLGTALVTMANAVTVTASLTGGGFNFECMITCQNVSNTSLTLQMDGYMNIGVVAAGTVSTAPQEIYFDANVATLNSEASAAIELFGTWSANNAANTTTLKQFMVFGLN